MGRHKLKSWKYYRICHRCGCKHEANGKYSEICKDCTKPKTKNKTKGEINGVVGLATNDIPRIPDLQENE